MITLIDVHNFPFKIRQHERGILFDTAVSCYSYYTNDTHEIVDTKGPWKLMFSFNEDIWEGDRLQVYIYSVLDYHIFHHLTML